MRASFGGETASSQTPAPVSQDKATYELVRVSLKQDQVDGYLEKLKETLPALLEQHHKTLIGLWHGGEDSGSNLLWVISHGEVDGKPARFWELEGVKPLVTSEVSVTANLLWTTDFSIQVKPIEPDLQHLYELRTYTPEPKGLEPLLARFHNHTCELFKKYGMINHYYWTNDAGQLVYFLKHRSQEAAAKSFDGFRADPHWIEVRKASEEKFGGSLTVPNGVVSEFYQALFLNHQ